MAAVSLKKRQPLQQNQFHNKTGIKIKNKYEGESIL